MNGRVEKDLFPELNTVLSESRIDLTHESQSSYAKKLGILQNNQGPVDFGPSMSTSTSCYVNQVTININHQTDERSQPPAVSYADSIRNENSAVPSGVTSGVNGVGPASSNGRDLGVRAALNRLAVTHMPIFSSPEPKAHR